MDIQDLYQEIIIDHGTHPRNCCELPDANGTAEGFNPLCGDKIHLYLKIQEDTIQKATFTGNGCAISMACISLVTEVLPGKTITEAQSLSKLFRTALQEEGCSIDKLGKLAALLGVKEFPSRIKCATLAWHTLEAAIHQDKPIQVTTESIDD